VKTVDFQDGKVVFARSNNPDDRLGEFLLRKGVISLRQYLESAALIAPGRRQGAVLCELGAISPAELVRSVTDQVTEILYSLFTWTAGEYELRPAAQDLEERIVLAISTEEVIVQGLRRVIDWHRIWRGIGGSPDVVFRPVRGAEGFVYRAALEPNETHVLSLVTGKSDVGALLDVSFASNFETCRILWALKLAGAIEPLPPGSGEELDGEDYDLAERVEAHDRVYALVFGFVAERIGDLVDHFMDRAGERAKELHPRALADVYLRNHGRVEYEQLHANLAEATTGARREQALAALEGILVALLELTTKELGPEEEGALRDLLLGIAPDVPLVPIAAVLRRATAAPTSLEGSGPSPL
jgi:hypothetical protein